MKKLLFIFTISLTAFLFANSSLEYPAAFSDKNFREAKAKQFYQKAQKEKNEAEEWARNHDQQIKFEINGVFHELMRVENGKPNFPWPHPHSTHVAGTIAAKGINSSAIGMAPNAKILSDNWISDDSEMISCAASAPNQTGKIYLSNHSYGARTGWFYGNKLGTNGWCLENELSVMFDKNFGMYSSYVRDWDMIAYDAPYYLIVKSSGNDRDDNPLNGSNVYFYSEETWQTTIYDDSIHLLGDGIYFSNGFDSISYKSLAKNILTVGAVDDAVSNNFRNLDFAKMSVFSGWGPADDGRIKPDVVGNGVDVFSCGSVNNTNYLLMSGTSMAAPNVCGSAALLIEHYRNFMPDDDMRASTLKGVIIHSADDIGNPGPDYSFGWGIMNTKEAADTIDKGFALSDTTTFISEELLDGGNPDDEFVFSIDGTIPFKATICWTDPTGTWFSSTHNDRTLALENDLDIRIISPLGTTNFPFILDVNNPSEEATTGDNIVDNVEQIIINTAATSGNYTIKVSHKNSLTAGHQYYSLIVSGAIPEPGFLLNFLCLGIIGKLVWFVKKSNSFD